MNLKMLMFLTSLFTCSQMRLFPIPIPNPRRSDFRVVKGDIDCDLSLPYNITSEYKRYTFESKYPIFSDTHVDGFLCSKEKWVSECYENFLTHQTKTFRIEPIRLNQYECDSAINEFNSGRLKVPFKPDFQCSWLASNTNAKEYILVRPHRVFFDHYSMSHVDKLFPGGRCSSFKCETKTDSLMWVAQSINPPSCIGSGSRLVTVYIHTRQTTLNSSFVESNEIPLEPLENVCQGLEYCKTSFYLTEYGHGFQVPTGKEYNALRSVFRGAPNCQNRKLSVATTNTEIRGAKRTLEDSIRLEHCLDTVEKISTIGKVTRRDLSHLTPLIPGIGMGYFIRNNTVLSRPVKYVDVRHYNLTCIPHKEVCMLNADRTGENTMVHQLKCTELISIDGVSHCDWFNGIMLSEDTIVFPLDAVMYSEYRDLLIMQHNVEFDQHIILNVSEEMKLTPLSDLPSTLNGDLLKYTEDSISGLFSSNIFKFVLIPAGCLILICLLVKVILSVRQNCRLQKGNDSETGTSIGNKVLFKPTAPDSIMFLK